MKLFIFILFFLLIFDTFQEQFERRKYDMFESVNRFPRASNGDFDSFHTRMALTARVFTGISLRIGFHDGSIPADDVLAELLNLDASVKLEDVEKFDKTKVDECVKQLVNLALESSISAPTEKMILTVDKWRELYEKITDPKDFQPLKDYIGKVKAFEAENIVYGTLDKLDDVPTTIGKIKKFLSGQPLDRNEIFNLEQNLIKISTMADEISGVFSKLKLHEALLDDIHLSSAYQFIQLLDLETVTGIHLGVQIGSAVNNELAQFFSKTKSVVVPKRDLAILIGLVSPSGQISKIHTSGFINGYMDLNTLPTDAQDSWLTAAIPEYKGDLIETELDPLVPLKEKSEALDTKWKTIVNDQNMAIARLLKETLSDIDSTGTAKVDWMLGTKQEYKNLPDSSDYKTPVIGIKNNIDKLRAEMFPIYSKLKSVTELKSFQNLKELCQLSEKIKFSGDPSTWPSQLPAILANMGQFSRMGELKDALEELHPMFVEIREVFKNDKLQTTATAIVSEKGKVDVFLNSEDTGKVITFFNSLKQSSAAVKKTAEAVRVVQNIRNMKSDQNFVNKVSSITQIIDSSIQDVQTLRAVPAAIKSTSTPGIDLLMQLAPIVTDSKTLGEAVTAVDNIQKILNSQKVIQTIIDKGWKVYEVAENGDSEEKKQVKIEWADFGHTHGNFIELLDDLKRKKKSTIITGSSLIDYSTMFVSFKVSIRLQFNPKDKIKVLKKLIAGSPSNDLNEVKDALEKLEKLNMDFARFNQPLDSVASAAQHSVTVFQSVRQLTSTTIRHARTISVRTDGSNPSPDSPLGSPLDSPSASRRMQTTTASMRNLGFASGAVESSWSTGKIVGTVVGCGGGAIVVCVVLILCCAKCKKKEKKNYKKLDQNGIPRNNIEPPPKPKPTPKPTPNPKPSSDATASLKKIIERLKNENELLKIDNQVLSDAVSHDIKKEWEWYYELEQYRKKSKGRKNNIQKAAAHQNPEEEARRNQIREELKQDPSTCEKYINQEEEKKRSIERYYALLVDEVLNIERVCKEERLDSTKAKISTMKLLHLAYNDCSEIHGLVCAYIEKWVDGEYVLKGNVSIKDPIYKPVSTTNRVMDYLFDRLFPRACPPETLRKDMTVPIILASSANTIRRAKERLSEEAAKNKLTLQVYLEQQCRNHCADITNRIPDVRLIPSKYFVNNLKENGEE